MRSTPRTLYVASMLFVQVGMFVFRYGLSAVSGVERFGTIDTIIVTANLLAGVLTIGMVSAAGHFVALQNERPRDAASDVTTALMIQTATLGATLVVGFIVATFLGDRSIIGFSSEEIVVLLVLTAAVAYGMTLATVLVSAEDFFAAGFANFGRIAVLLGGLAIFALRPEQVSIVAMGLAVAGAWATQALWALLRVSRSIGRGVFDRASARRLLRYGSSILVHISGGWALLALDRIVLKARVDDIDLSRYSFAYFVAFGYTQLYQLVNNAWRADVYRVLGSETGEVPTAAVLGRYFARPRRLVVLLSSVAMLTMPVIARLIAPVGYDDIADIVAVLSVAAYWLGQYFTTVNIVFHDEKVVYLSVATLLSGLSTAVPIILLVDRYGIIVAAWATMMGYLLLFCAGMYVVRRICERPVGVADAVVPGLALSCALGIYLAVPGAMANAGVAVVLVPLGLLQVRSLRAAAGVTPKAVAEPQDHGL